jgi:hypothetical protein
MRPIRVAFSQTHSDERYPVIVKLPRKNTVIVAYISQITWCCIDAICKNRCTLLPACAKCAHLPKLSGKLVLCSPHLAVLMSVTCAEKAWNRCRPDLTIPACDGALCNCSWASQFEYAFSLAWVCINKSTTIDCRVYSRQQNQPMASRFMLYQWEFYLSLELELRIFHKNIFDGSRLFYPCFTNSCCHSLVGQLSCQLQQWKYMSLDVDLDLSINRYCMHMQ